MIQNREEQGWSIDGFQSAILLTPFNQAVWTFANLQARNMGLKTGKQIVWIKTKDTPPKSWREFFPDEAALAKEQSKWLHINTRRRNNIPGLLPIFEGMQIRINNGSGSHYKEYGLHTGSLGTVVGMQLSEDETNKLQHNQSPEVTLDSLPEKIFIKVQGKMTKCFPGLEEGIFPIVPRTTDWHLFSSQDTTVTIHTKGYAISPYYSSTIDSITGRTVDKAIVEYRTGQLSPGTVQP